MNANRTRYTSTPTYGMQKRGFLKKAPVHQPPEAPDFSQAAQQAAAATQQLPGFASAVQPTALPVQQPVMPPMQQPAVFMAQNVQNAPLFAQPAPQQVPFAAPTFLQPGASPWQTGTQNMGIPAVQPLPLANSAPISSTPAGGNFRAQGYVPPAVQPAQPAQQPVQQPPASFAPQMPLFPLAGQQPAMQQPPFAQQPGGMMGGMQQPPFGAAPGMQQGFFTPAPAQESPRQRKPLTFDAIWGALLFAVLPALFVITLFLSDSADALRYVFLGLTVCGLGCMWYRQMYTSSTRLITSIVYVALCIVTIATLMQSPTDAQQTGAPVRQPAQTQAAYDAQGAVVEATPTAPQPTPEPTYTGPSEAESRLEMFMTLWQSNNVEKMVALVQPSWASAQEVPANSLFALLKGRIPEGFTIEDISGTDQDTSRTVTMSATINKNNGKDPSIYRFMVLMVREGNEWYVDPNSLATNDAVATTDENSVNSQETARTTEAPRTTVTPAPPGDTTLYYNASGGSYYHMDAYCSSVRDEYLPLTGTFAYSELGSYNNTLLPCLKCGAPTETLD